MRAASFFNRFLLCFSLAAAGPVLSQVSFPWEDYGQSKDTLCPGGCSNYAREHTFTFMHGFMPYREGTKWGVVNARGEIVVKAQYDRFCSRHDYQFVAISEKGCMLYDDWMNPIFDQLLATVNYPSLMAYMKWDDAKMIAYLNNAEPHLIEHTEWSAAEAELDTTLIDSVFTLQKGDSIVSVIHFRDGTTARYTDPVNNYSWAYPCYLVLGETPGRGAGYINLRTGKRYRVPLNCFSGPFSWKGTDYHVTLEKYNYVIRDDSGRKIKESADRLYFSHGMIFRGGYNFYAQEMEPLYATWLETGKPVAAHLAGYTHAGEFLVLTDSTGVNRYYNESGALMFSATGNDCRTMAYFSASKKQDLLFVQQTGKPNRLLNSRGKVLLETTEELSAYDYDEHDNLFKIGYEALGIYDPAADTMYVIHQQYVEPFQPGKLLARNFHEEIGAYLSPTVLDYRGNVLDSLPVQFATWVPAGDGGIIVGSVPETDQQLLDAACERLAAQKRQFDWPAGEANEQPQVYKTLYFDKDLQPVEFPEVYLFSVFKEHRHDPFMKFSTAGNPYVFGVMDGDRNTVLPQRYIYIDYDPMGHYFIVIDEQGNMDYIRAEGY